MLVPEAATADAGCRQDGEQPGNAWLFRAQLGGGGLTGNPPAGNSLDVSSSCCKAHIWA